ncbi:PTS lactose/cellobiose transporter subunit IIA [Paraliobacillus salinarum]|uniref:PTS lactose/cellobiose transporter subunit IIA n=1 Tax=Paraliobacillus salinarum TaxID=1158996 RepID=UPI0015F6CCC3|nr:PTS lactose/cellobiose transporter subunit IIA [Paraliobacillus salinarum]
MENEEIIMGIIMHGGNARSAAMRAMAAAKKANFDEAEELLDISKKELGEAHKVQTNLIQGEARGEKTEVSLLMVHAQDHLMNAMTVRDLAEEIIDMKKIINSLL